MRRKNNFWGTVANLILRNRFLIIGAIVLVTLFLSSQWQYMRFTFTEANLLPSTHPENIQYDSFVDTFGEEGNLMVIALKEEQFFEPKIFEKWIVLNRKIDSFQEVDFTLSTNNVQELVKDEKLKSFVLKSVFDIENYELSDIEKFKQKLLLELPFYKNILYDSDGQTIQSAIYLDKNIVNTIQRKDFIFKTFIPLINTFEKDTGLDVKISGMPYIRTLNAQNIVDEIGVFVLSAMLLTSLIFFLFFRSFRATFISMFVVMIGVMWAFGILGLLRYEITILTALIPPLIIVIGVPNCIFLINKYQQEVAKHGNMVKSLQRVIMKIGNATLMTNLTTASGFATFILTDSKVLKEFGIVASINIIAIFLLSLLIIPIAYSFMSQPSKKHLKHLNSLYLKRFVKWMEDRVKHNRINVYIISIFSLVMGVIGIYQINISGSIIEDMPKKSEFFKDILFFDAEFNGIVPIEIIVDSRRKGGATRLSTLKRIDKLEQYIEDIPELSTPISSVSGVKFIKQAYYNGNPNYYKLPTSQENSFIASYLKNVEDSKGLMQNYVDSTAQFNRVTTFMKDIPTDRIEEIEDDLLKEINRIFPPERYHVKLTGKTLLYLKGTHYLIRNLIISLSLAILLIAVFMAYMFRSFKMIVISLIPNLLPLIITAGVMGFSGIPLKPSTILVFSIAFGISVDDTIHFLAKYRQELIANKWKIKTSVYIALRETAVSMFYTSIVLFFGFAVFMSSNFGGTVALGGLVSVTLLFAMLANLILLPSLLISLEDTVSNEKVIKAPKINIISDEDRKKS
ncbi:efflux RND transporter permease subunit [Flavobacteriaceae bacterium]|nr:efflux RND transporter permease subunit [Flavobacteriaceae bacterium]MDC3238335.1 efflux RND transporter permease subunit [Flavobacteriaceae bacterium]